MNTNAALTAAGQTLTTGAFLTYFGEEHGATPLQTAFLATAPEIAGAAGVLVHARPVAALIRPRWWFLLSLLSRLTLLAIPALAFIHRTQPIPLWVLVMLIAVSQSLHGISNSLFFGWLSQLAPSQEWGRFFARRTIAALLMQMVIPITAGLIRDVAKTSGDPAIIQSTYAALFASGGVLLLAALLPMRCVPAMMPTGQNLPLEPKARLRWTNDLVCLMGHSWTLSIANGLTQAVLVRYLFRELHVGLTHYYSLLLVMQLLQIPCARWAGDFGDRYGPWRPLCVGTAVASLGIGFWLLVNGQQTWWLLGAYLCWGAFGAVNVAGPQLLLQVSTPGMADAAWSWFRQAAGLLAGLSGLVGGWCLGWLLEQEWAIRDTSAAYRTLFLISWAGRMLAVAWLWGVRAGRSPLFCPSSTREGD